MRSCLQMHLIGPWLDGQLSPGAAAEVQRHVDDCPACRREADSLRGLSALLASATLPEIPAGLLDSLHRQADVAGQRVVYRLAEWLSAAAAAIIVVSALVLGLGGSDRVRADMPHDWELTAVAGPTDPNMTEPQQLARWIETDLSQENPR